MKLLNDYKQSAGIRRKDDNIVTRQMHLELFVALRLAKGGRKFAGAAAAAGRHTGIWMLTAAAVRRRLRLIDL
jgi:hypothetical protein